MSNTRNADDTQTTPVTPPASGPERKPIAINSPLLQAVGAEVYQINVQTTAEQVLMGDGTNAATRLKTLENAVSGQTHTHIKDTIADRDAMTGLIAGDQCWVIDATADPTVEKGGAKYLYMMDHTWLKVGEAESLDVVCDWSHIQNRPQSSVADIDLAVAKQHTHSNIDTLSHLSDDGAGNLLFRGKRINDGLVWGCMVKDLSEIPANLADGCLVVLMPGAGGDDAGADGGDGDSGSDAGTGASQEGA